MIKAFVGHSFTEYDHDIVRRFLDFFDRVGKLGIGFTWDHAEPAEPKELSVKVKEKMEGKNLFIGICTSREKVIDFKKLRIVPLLKNRLWGVNSDFAVKTSDWILQEIGFAVGRDMKLIILLEEGVKTPGGIQGNLEYILFTRESPDRCFEKLLEMLEASSGLTSQAEASESTKTERPISKVESSDVDTAKEELPFNEWKLENYDMALVGSIYEKDEKMEKELSVRFTESEFGKDPSQLINWNARRLYLQALFNKNDTLSQLLSLLEENPHNPDVLHYIACVYELFTEYKRAASTFEESASITEDPEKKFTRLSYANLDYAKIGEKNKTILIERQVRLMINQIKNGSAKMLNLLADTANTLGDTTDYKAFTEAALELSPDDHGRRFSLAYKYSEDNENDLAFYHYRILTDRNPDGANWNNFGVALGRMNLDFSAVSAYRNSEKFGETLAMSNLAFKLIKEGFLKEANDLIKTATSKEDCSPNIGDNITLIKTTQDHETEEKEKIFKSIKTVRQFFIDYANACLKDDVKSLPENWKSPKCQLNIKIHYNFLEITGSYDKKLSPYELALLDVAKKKPNKENIKYNGRINGYGVMFQFWVWEGDEPLKPDAKPKNTGLLIIDDNKERIRIMESGTRKDEDILEISQVK
jgi:tetratricopeptide (TPR) repeat protein